MSGRVVKRNADRLRKGEKFFDSWTPQSAWALGVVCERAAVDSSHGTVVEAADTPLLRAFCGLVKEARLCRDRRTVVIESLHVAERLLALGMEEGAFSVRRVPSVPEEYVPYVIRGILDTQGVIASFGPYLAELSLEFPTRQKACLRFMHRELKRRGYSVREMSKEIDFLGIAREEPASYKWTLTMSKPEDVIDCYKWLYRTPIAGLSFNRAQRWVWSQLHWLLRDLEACSRMLKDKKMLSELREVIREGKRAKLMGDWKEL
ncbi:MAG: hypothetical protein JW880_04980 [Candidatus Thermoplasmatota archaeon]|nr:hypothetical protein [Candidatus Thermoplasmatota archaeon]